MHPVLFKVGSLPIHTYGFLIAVGFLVALAVIRWLARKDGLDVERILDLCFYAFLVGFVGARLLYVVTAWDQFAQDPMAVFRVWEGGLVFFGGPMAAVPFIYWYLKKHRLPFWRAADTLVPGLVIAHAFGRLGCLGAGCCYGKPTGTDFGIRFQSELVDPALRGIALHPTQLYEAGALLVLFGGLLWVWHHRRFAGQAMFTYFLAYPVIRSVIEVYRGDLVRGFVIEGLLSTSQFISLLVFLAAAAILFVRLKRTSEGAS